MRLWSGMVTGLVAAVTLLLLVIPFEGATTKKKTKRRVVTPAPKVSPAVRAASLQRVNDYLEDSPRNIAQPGALVPVFEQLFRLSSDPAKTPVHILHFGDSHTAADDWTGGLRDLFKDKFGDGGSGFSLAGHPFAGYRRFDAPHGGGTPGWQTHGLASATGDGYFGLGGVSVSTVRSGQTVYIDAECDFLEIEYLQQPGGGDLALYDYDERLE